MAENSKHGTEPWSDSPEDVKRGSSSISSLATATTAPLHQEDSLEGSERTLLASNSPLTTSIMNGRKFRQRRESAGWTINKLRYSNLGVHGRKEEIQILDDCLQRVCVQASTNNCTNHKSQLVLIDGYSGTGKSTLAMTLQQKVTVRKGIFTSGKFDFQHRNQPYAGIIEACRVIAQIVMDVEKSHPALDKATKEKIQQLLPSQVEQRCLSEICPDLLEMHQQQGEHQRVEETRVREASGAFDPMNSSYKIQWRWGVHEFLRTIQKACAGPLVLLLDDLQWADSDSLDLIEFIMNNENNNNKNNNMKTRQFKLLVIGCYRTNEVNDAHILSTVLRDMRSSSRRERCSFDMTEMSLGNLNLAGVHQVLMDLLGMDDCDNNEGTCMQSSPTMGLAKICHRRTNGNAFFVIAFLTMLKERGLLEYNFGLMKWTWNDATIEAETVAANNVVDLIKTKMTSQLDVGVRRVLQLAACLGTSFQERLIAVLWEELVSEESRRGLEKCSHRQLLEDAIAESFLELVTPSTSSSSKYRWVHDKVQEAAMSSVEPKERANLKFQAGIVLARRLTVEEREASIFIVCNLLNDGSIAEERAERIQSAQLNLQAARKAVQFSAFTLAEKYACRGIELLPQDDCWETNKELSLELYSTATEVENILGRVDRMQQYSRVVLDHPTCTIIDKLRVYDTLIDSIGSRARSEEAQELCFDTLGKLGCRFPTKAVPSFALALRGILRAQKAAKDLDRIMAPKMNTMMDARSIQEMKLLDRAHVLAYQTESKIRCALVALRMLKLTKERGFSEFSPLAFTLVGIMIVALLSDYEAGLLYSRFAMKLIKKFKSRRVESRCIFRASGIIEPWSLPFASCLKQLLRGYEVGLQTGDIEAAMLSIILHCSYGLAARKPLECIAEDIEVFSRQMSSLKRVLVIQEAETLWRFVFDMMGRSSEPICKFYSERSECAAQDVLKPRTVASQKYFKTMTLVFLGDYQAAADLALDTGDSLQKSIPGFPVTFVDAFYRAIALLAASPNANSMMRIRYKRSAMRSRKMIARWIDKGNPNLRHFQSLLDAEFAVLDKKPDMAKEFYQMSAVQAARAGILHEAALANERFAHFLLHNLNDREEAKFRLHEATRLYSEWGAVRKVEMLQRTLSEL